MTTKTRRVNVKIMLKLKKSISLKLLLLTELHINKAIFRENIYFLCVDLSIILRILPVKKKSKKIYHILFL